MSLDLTPQNREVFFSTAQAVFQSVYQTTPVWHEKISTPKPLATEIWGGGWTGKMPKYREWEGERVVHSRVPQTYLVTVDKPYELTFGYDLFKLAADIHGLMSNEMMQAGFQAKKLKDYMLRDLIFGLGKFAGAAQKTYDTLTHWNTAHPVNFYDASFGTYSNDYVGGFTEDGVTVGGAISFNAYRSVFVSMTVRKGDDGEALGIMPDLALSSVHLMTEFRTILNSMTIAPASIGNLGTGAVGTPNAPFVGATSSPFANMTDYESITDFSVNSTTNKQWFMLQTKGVIEKPFLMIVRHEPDLIVMNQPDAPAVFKSNQIQIGSKALLKPAWGHTALSSRSGPA